jgi:hypothetical protein
VGIRKEEGRAEDILGLDTYVDSVHLLRGCHFATIVYLISIIIGCNYCKS